MGGFAKLGIDLPSLIAQIVNFLILLTLLYLFAYKPILRMLDERSKKIREGVEQADRIKGQAAQAEEQVKAQIEAGRKEGQAIIAQAAQMGERLKEEARQGARQEAESAMARARQEIQRERDEAFDRLRQEFAGLAITAAEKVIRETLDKEKHRRLIQEVLEESGTLKPQ